MHNQPPKKPASQLPARFDINKARFTKRRTQPSATRDRHNQPNLQVYDDHSGMWLWWWMVASEHPTATLSADTEIVPHTHDEPVSGAGGDFAGGGASGSWDTPSDSAPSYSSSSSSDSGSSYDSGSSSSSSDSGSSSSGD